MQEPQPLCVRLLDEKIDAGRVATGAGKTGDKTKPDRVIADAKDDRNRCCRSFRRERRQTTGRGNHRYLSANQFGQQRRQPIILTVQPVVLDDDVWPSTKPVSLRPLRNAATKRVEVSGDPSRISATTGIFSAFCARAASGHAAAALPRSDINSRRLIAAPTFRIGHRTG